MEFKNYKNKEKRVVLKPINGRNRYQEHKLAAIRYYLKCSYDIHCHTINYIEEKIKIERFIQEIKQLAEDLEIIFHCDYDMNSLSLLQQHELNQVTLYYHLLQMSARPFPFSFRS